MIKKSTNFFQTVLGFLNIRDGLFNIILCPYIWGTILFYFRSFWIDILSELIVSESFLLKAQL